MSDIDQYPWYPQCPKCLSWGFCYIPQACGRPTDTEGGPDQ